MYKNNIDLIGFLGSDPEARSTSNGTAVTTFSLATKSSWKNEAGSYESRTEWHRIVAWGKLAESAAKLSKGAHIEVEGELRHRTYPKEVAVGQKAVAVDIPVSEIHVRTLRKLDRSSNQTESEVTEEGASVLFNI
jgi:single-strand DNA-binding protein